MPGGGDGLGTETLSGSLNAEHEQASWRFEAEGFRFRSKRIFTLGQPFFQSPHAADFTQIQRRFDIFEQAAALCDPPFARDHSVDIIVVKTPVLGHGVDDDLLGLATG